MDIIINSHKGFGGFFSQFNMILQGLELYDEMINRAIWDVHDAPAFRYNNGEIFKKLFKEYDNNKLSTETITHNTFFNVNYTAHLVAEKYQSPQQKEWRTKFNKIYKKYFVHTDYLNNTFNDILKPQFDQYKNIPKIGILIRNNNLGPEQPRKTSPTIDLYLDAIRQHNLNDFALVCGIDNNQDLNFFKTHFNTIYNPYTSRSETASHNEPHHSGSLQAVDAAYHYLEGYMLSMCDYLIHPVSNVATGALIMNPELKNVFVIG
jgi:hypothetical protein